MGRGGAGRGGGGAVAPKPRRSQKLALPPAGGPTPGCPSSLTCKRIGCAPPPGCCCLLLPSLLLPSLLGLLLLASASAGARLSSGLLLLPCFAWRARGRLGGSSGRCRLQHSYPSLWLSRKQLAPDSGSSTGHSPPSPASSSLVRSARLVAGSVVAGPSPAPSASPL